MYSEQLFLPSTTSLVKKNVPTCQPHQGCSTQTGLKSLNLSIFIVNNFNCAINCLNMNRVTICRAKCLGIVTLKVLWTSCSRFNSGEKSPKFMIPKKELLRVSLCKFFNKMFGVFRENDRFLKIFLFIYLKKFTHSFQFFTKCFGDG